MTRVLRSSFDSFGSDLGRWIILLAFLALHCGDATAAFGSDTCVSLESGDPPVSALSNTILYYEDPGAGRTLQDILGDPAVAWTPLREATPSFGFSSSAFWLNFAICASGSDKERPVLEIAYPLLDTLHVYAAAGENVVYQVRTGDSLPFGERPVHHRNFVFPLPGTGPDILHIYIRVQTSSAVQVPMRIYTQDGFFNHNQRSLLLQGVYFGLILAMVLYNAFLFFSLRELPYLFYVLFTTSYFSFQGVLQGLFQQFVFHSVWLQNHTLLIFGYASILFANLFAASFLNLRAKNHLLWNILRGVGAISALAAAVSSVLPYEIMVKMMLILAIPSSLLIMAAGFRLWWAGHLPARIFTIAWSTLLISFVLASFNKFGILPRTFWTENIMQIGGVLEVILLSIALAERVNEEKRQRILVEQQLATSLEEEVQQRTQELNQALAQLEAANAILDEISHTDSLTQIANRRAFDIQLALEYKGARRDGHPLALIMIDIDCFKLFNDTHGHQTGDRVLQEVAGRLAALATRPGDKVFRYGGEEFVVLLRNTDLAGARTVAERMRISIAGTPVDIDGRYYALTISAGISVFASREGASSPGSAEDLILRADRCLYHAKENGRNRLEADTG